MSRFVLPLLVACLLGAHSSTLRAQGPKSADEKLLKQVEKQIRNGLKNIEKELRFERPYPGALIVNYRTRKFMVHGQTRIGKYSDKPQETIGPSYQGFRLRLSIQEAGVVNAAVIPQTLKRPYWMTDLDIRLLEGTGKQLYCGLSRGSRLDSDLLKRVRKVIGEFGKASYLTRNRPTKR